MSTIEFKKLDKETYLVTDGNNALNMYVRYSKYNKQYSVDISQYYFEESTIEKIKAKVQAYWMQGKFELFEVNY